MKEPLGPNVKRLWAAFVAREAIQPSTKEGAGLAAGIGFIVGLSKNTPESAAALKRARENTEAALAAVKAASGNPYGDDEEAIAGAILAKVDARKHGGDR
jgi:hypothetical protein